jgi:hypothetical protein
MIMIIKFIYVCHPGSGCRGPLTRREVIVGGAALAAVTVLGACSSGSATRSTPEGGEDGWGVH